MEERGRDGKRKDEKGKLCQAMSEFQRLGNYLFRKVLSNLGPRPKLMNITNHLELILIIIYTPILQLI